MTTEIGLNSDYTANVKSLSDVELTTEIKTASESVKSQSQKLQAVKFLDFGQKVPESAIEYIANKFVMPKNTVRTIENSFNGKTGEQLDDKVFYQVPDTRLISLERILGSTVSGQIYLDSLYSGKDLTMSKSQFEDMSKILKAAEKAHGKHSKDVKLVQAFESSKKLFKSEVYLSLTKLKLKFLRNEEITRKQSEVNAAVKRIAEMHKNFGKLELKTTVQRIE